MENMRLVVIDGISSIFFVIHHGFTSAFFQCLDLAAMRVAGFSEAVGTLLLFL
jgi:hypothetical protein